MAQQKAQPAGSTEHPSGGHGGKFPPFESHTFASQVLWLAIVFIALYWLMSRVALPRIGSILEARRAQIAGDLAEAQRLKDQSDAAIAAYEKALAEARARAQALANETREKEAAAAEVRRKTLEAELNTKIAEAEKSIAVTRSSAMANVRGIAAEAASAIVERLVGVAPAGQEVANAVGDALKR